MPSAESKKKKSALPDVPARLVRLTYWGVGLGSATVLILHTVKADVNVDTTSLGLLALLLVLPLAPYITKLKAAGIEAEIGAREVDELEDRAARLPEADEQAGWPAEAPTIVELVERDPVLGLAALRIELEKAIRAIHLDEFDDLGPRRGMALGQMVRALTKKGTFDPSFAGVLNDVIGLANRAVHGEHVAHDQAYEIAQIGIRLLGPLQQDAARAASGDGDAFI